MKKAWVAAHLIAGLSIGTPAQGGPAWAQAGSPNARRPPWESLAIVVNPKNPTSNVTLGELREILLGERQWWACKLPRITLTARPRGSAERETLTRTIYRMDDAASDKYFFFEVYRGVLPTSPTILDTAAEVKKFVSRTPGAVGYVRASDVDDSVKILRIDGLFPEDDGYPLRLHTRVAK